MLPSVFPHRKLFKINKGIDKRLGAMSRIDNGIGVNKILLIPIPAYK